MKPEDELYSDENDLEEGTLSNLLRKFKTAKSMPLSIRLHREDVEGLIKIEAATDLSYSWLIRMLVRRLVGYWRENQRIQAPLYVCIMSEEQAHKLGLTKDK